MNSADKLKKLQSKKAGKNMVIVSNGEPFIEALSQKINQLKNVLGEEVGVDAADLIEQLSKIDKLAPNVEELIAAIDEIDIPKTIELQGIEAISESLKKEVEALDAFAKKEFPKLKLELESISDKSAKELGDRIESAVDENKKHNEKLTDSFTHVIETFTKLVESVEDNLAESERQDVDKYISIRRVRKVGNKLVFDDDYWAGGGGGGGSSVQAGLIRNSNSVAVVNGDGGGIDDSSSIYDGSTKLTPKFAAISESSSGSQEIVAAVATKKIRVLSYAIVVNGTVNVKWQSDATDITGLMYFIANTGISAGYNPKGHFETAAGEALNLNLSAGVALGGHISYVEV